MDCRRGMGACLPRVDSRISQSRGMQRGCGPKSCFPEDSSRIIGRDGVGVIYLRVAVGDRGRRISLIDLVRESERVMEGGTDVRCRGRMGGAWWTAYGGIREWASLGSMQRKRATISTCLTIVDAIYYVTRQSTPTLQVAQRVRVTESRHNVVSTSASIPVIHATM